MTPELQNALGVAAALFAVLSGFALIIWAASKHKDL